MNATTNISRKEISMDAKVKNPLHYMLIKKDGYAADGTHMSARASAIALLDAGYWPLWSKTKCRLLVAPGDKILVYLAGHESDAHRVIASAVVSEIREWSPSAYKEYPLTLDGIPDRVMHLQDVVVFEKTSDIRDYFGKLEFIPAGRKKWGVFFMGGMRQVTPKDFKLLSAARGTKSA